MVKDIVESVESRISAPYFGYLICSFLAINWEPLFYLFWAKQNVSDRITFFNEHTNLLTTILAPIILGAFFTVASPYLKYWFAKVVDKPVRNKRTLDIMADEAAKRTRKDQAQRDQIEVLEAKLKEADQSLENQKKETENQATITSTSINNLTKEIENKKSDLTEAGKLFQNLSKDHDKLLTDFNNQVEVIANQENLQKDLDSHINEKYELKMRNATLSEEIKDLNNKEIVQKSLQDRSDVEIEHLLSENKSLTEKLKRDSNRYSQYKNYSILLEQLNATMLKRDDTWADENQIKSLTEKLKVVKKHINET